MNSHAKLVNATIYRPFGGAGCCDADALSGLVDQRGSPDDVDPRGVTVADPSAFVVDLEDGFRRLDLLVENLHCAACIGKIETRLRQFDAVHKARVNLSTRRLSIVWRDCETDPVEMMRAVAALGYPVTPFDATEAGRADDAAEKRLLSSLAVAGFAAANVMLLSVAVWSGHAGGMGDGTRTLFHWISALIALPAVLYAGQPFFVSAFRALKARSLNMDVPISLAVILASGMSVVQTMQEAEHAYFDASVMLLFFLLIGRYLDRRSRTKARSAALHLLALQARAATVIETDGRHRALRINDVRPGMRVLIAVGERVPVDAEVDTGVTDIDTALITGESAPKLARPGDVIYAGTLNLTAPIEAVVTQSAETSLLSEIVRLMETAEQGRAKFVRLADRVSRIYAPVVHVLALATFLGWMVLTNAGWQASLMTAIAVLIITCPCALGLAVPAVQVVASGRLLRAGVLVKSSDALEKLAGVDTVVFDKTGTLTMGDLSLVGGTHSPDDLRLAAALGAHSRHPVARALVRAAGDAALPALRAVTEMPGFGITASVDGEEVRLGRRDWCGALDNGAKSGSTVWLKRGAAAAVTFYLEDRLRDDALQTVDGLRRLGCRIALLSGDTSAAVAPVATALGIDDWHAGCLPTDKTARLESMASQGGRVLMVGDGLNDAPSLAAAHVSMSPVNAADVTQTAADLLFQGKSLSPVLTAIRVARMADGLVRQNFVLAFTYNAIAVPIAALGFATPLVAAVAMSASSLLVTMNALRLKVLR